MPLVFFCTGTSHVSHPFVGEKNMKVIFLSVLDYGDIIYSYDPGPILKRLEAVYHSAVRFITDDPYGTQHCILYQKVGWLALTVG